MFSGELFDYQAKDVERVSSGVTGILNANKMGYGKTVEAIWLMEHWKCHRILIICPKTVIYQWQEAVERWTDHGVEVLPKRIHDVPQITIVNYDKIANGTFEKRGRYKFFHPGPYLQQFLSFQWDLIICDEVHRIKNRDAKVTRALEKLPARQKMGLSGTPILRRPDDLFSILHWLNPSYAGNSYWDFVYKYCDVEKGPFGNVIKGLTRNETAQKELIALLEPFTIRNPDLVIGKGKLITEVSLAMPPKQATLYKNAKNLILDELPDNCTIFNGMSKLIRLQQIASNPAMFGVDDNVKFAWILEQCEDNPDTKFVVYSKFAKTIEALRRYLYDNDIITGQYTGDVPVEDRHKMLYDFTHTDHVQVLAGTIGALGTGVDGLQQVCYTAIFLDRDWSPALNEQAEDRLNRIGQKDRVNIYNLTCNKTIDKYVGRINLSKITDIRKILDHE